MTTVILLSALITSLSGWRPNKSALTALSVATCLFKLSWLLQSPNKRLRENGVCTWLHDLTGLEQLITSTYPQSNVLLERQNKTM